MVIYVDRVRRLLLLGGAEPLLFIDHHETQVLELDVFRGKAVGADHDVDFARLQAFDGGLLLRR